MRAACLSLCSLLLLAAPAAADTAGRLHTLVNLPGVSGHEDRVREAIEMMLPTTARVRADHLGSIVLRMGSGSPHTLIVAPLDEGGLLVSAITEDGYLRVHRHTAEPPVALATEYLIGQPVRIHTADGSSVDGVIATPSTHLRRFADPASVARIKTLDDIWVDVGAESRDEVEGLGIRMLDSVTLRERATALAGGLVAGVGATGRGGALALAEAVRGAAPRGSRPGMVSLAWVAQSEYGNRGLVRLLDSLKPDRVVIVRGAIAPGEDPHGATGTLGGGPLIATGNSTISDAAVRAKASVQTVAPERLRVNLPDRFKDVPVDVIALPARFAHTPVETVSSRDVEALARIVMDVAGLEARTDSIPDSTDSGSSTDSTDFTDSIGASLSSNLDQPPFPTLAALIEAHGVSGHEGAVREEILKRLPEWAKPEIDSLGNVTVTFGAGGKALVFLAHMDEVGFEITGINADGSAAVRTRGGMYLSLYEAQAMEVQTPGGVVPAVMMPRRGYPTATTPQPEVADVALYFGTGSADETQALGVAEGQSATIRKTLARLAGSRAAGRAMDDRNGSTALLLALKRIDPATIPNRVTFAWTVEEETGLTGAEAIAARMTPHTAFAVDTFVSSHTPVDNQRVAAQPLGQGAVLRGLDSRSLARAGTMDRITMLAAEAGIPLQIGVTSGGTDASPFSAVGAIDLGLSWPGRYSHSPVEVMDGRDLEALVKIIVLLARQY